MGLCGGRAGRVGQRDGAALEQAGAAAQAGAGKEALVAKYKVSHQVTKLANGDRESSEPDESNGNSDVAAKGLAPPFRSKKRRSKPRAQRAGRR